MTVGGDDGVTPDPVPVTSSGHHHFTQNGKLVTQIQFLYPIDEDQDQVEAVTCGDTKAKNNNKMPVSFCSSRPVKSPNVYESCPKTIFLAK